MLQSVARFIHPSVLTTLFISVLLGFSVAIFVLNLLDSRVYDENGKQIPGPIHHLWGRNYLFAFRIGQLTRQYSKAIHEVLLCGVGDGNIAAFNTITGSPNIIIAHPDMVKTVLSAHHLKFATDDSWQRLRDIFHDGLRTCDDRSWSKFRNVVMPCFRSQSLKGMVTIFNIHSRRLLRHWHFRLRKVELLQKEANSIPVMIDEDFRNLVVGIMCEAGFGYDFFINTNSNKIAADFDIIVAECTRRMMQPPAWNAFVTMQAPKDFQESVTRFRNLILHSYEERREHIARGNDDLEYYDLLQLVIDANDETHENHRLTSDEIVDQVMTFVFMGFESIVSTLMWMVLELAKHPDIQTKCAAEVDSIMNVNGVRTSAVVFDDIPKFTLLIQVLKETLRLHPPVPTLVRHCTASCRVGDYMVKKGSFVSISLLALHKHPDFWYLPKEFYPDRFSKENIAGTIKNPFQYVPFGGGSRNCIGQRFGQMAVVVIMSVLLARFEFKVEREDIKDIVYEEAVCYHPRNLRLKISSRVLEEEGINSQSQ